MDNNENNIEQTHWYSNIANKIGKGLVQFLLPVTILLYIFEKVFTLIQGFIEPIKSHLPKERIFGIGMFTLITILIVLLVCYIAGVLSTNKNVKSFLAFIDDNVLVFIPGYALLKTEANENIKNTDNKWKVVVINDDGDLKYGIEVNKRSDGYSLLFFPEPPDAKSGEMKMVLESKFKRIDLPVSKLSKIIRNYGLDSEDILK
jgi:uncharacterized membrane protein